MRSPGPEQITGVVLAGGQSRRMGGVNKALVLYRGKPLFQYAVDNLAPCCHQVLINSNRDSEVYRESGFTVFGDGDFTDCGPVAGIHAALDFVSTPFVAFAACDQLALPAHVYQTLCASVTEDRGAFACTVEDRVPTCSVLPIRLVNAARQALESDNLALMAFMRAHAKAVKFEDVHFANVNSRHQVDDK